MQIAWENFTPYSALLGGVLIGAAASLLMMLNGKIAGVSGIASGIMTNIFGERLWRLCFVGGLIVSPMVYQCFAPIPEIKITGGWTSTILAGLIVGIGTRFASGCTSGHGVCGLARCSFRSLIATMCFMFTGFLTVYLMRRVGAA